MFLDEIFLLEKPIYMITKETIWYKTLNIRSGKFVKWNWRTWLKSYNIILANWVIKTLFHSTFISKLLLLTPHDFKKKIKIQQSFESKPARK